MSQNPNFKQCLVNLERYSVECNSIEMNAQSKHIQGQLTIDNLMHFK